VKLLNHERTLQTKKPPQKSRTSPLQFSVPVKNLYGNFPTDFNSVSHLPTPNPAWMPVL
jgi:hypothetical protein